MNSTSEQIEICRDEAVRRSSYEEGMALLARVPTFMDSLSEEQQAVVMEYRGEQTIGTRHEDTALDD